MFRQSDETRAGVDAAAAAARSAAQRVFLAVRTPRARPACRRSRCIPLLEPILQIQSFYRAANALAVARGLDPDRPPHLAKVTETR